MTPNKKIQHQASFELSIDTKHVTVEPLMAEKKIKSTPPINGGGWYVSRRKPKISRDVLRALLEKVKRRYQLGNS